MNPVSEFDILKYRLIEYRRLTPASELEGINRNVNYNYHSVIIRSYPASAAGLEQLTVDVERKAAGRVAGYLMRRYRRI